MWGGGRASAWLSVSGEELLSSYGAHGLHVACLLLRDGKGAQALCAPAVFKGLQPKIILVPEWHSCVLSSFLPPPAGGTRPVLFVCADLTTLGLSCKWNPMGSVLWGLAYVARRGVLRALPCSGRCLTSSSSGLSRRSPFVRPSPHRWMPSRCLIAALADSPAANLGVHVTIPDPAPGSSGGRPDVGLPFSQELSVEPSEDFPAVATPFYFPAGSAQGLQLPLPRCACPFHVLLSMVTMLAHVTRSPLPCAPVLWVCVSRTVSDAARALLGFLATRMRVPFRRLVGLFGCRARRLFADHCSASACGPRRLGTRDPRPPRGALRREGSGGRPLLLF